MEKHITVPFDKETAKSLKAGDYVYLTGTIYTARDAAHKRMQETLTAGKELPISIDGTIIYYMGPSPAREGRPIGSAGPTTASRMDKYAPQLLDLGLLGLAINYDTCRVMCKTNGRVGCVNALSTVT